MFACRAKGDSQTVTFVALVNLQNSFHSLLSLGGAEGKRLILGAHGYPKPASDPHISMLVRTEPNSTLLKPLLIAMRRGDSGLTHLPEGTARQLEMKGEFWIAYSPVRLLNSAHWSVAVFAPSKVTHILKTTLMRILGVVGLLLVCLAGVAVVVMRSARRQTELHANLAHARNLAQLQQQLLRSEKMATVGILTAGLAHEIGTPLGVVRARAEFIARKLGNEHPHHHGLEIVMQQIDRVSRIISQLLDFARKKPATSEILEPVAIAQSVVELVQPIAKKKQLTLVLECSDDLPAIRGNSDEMQQAVLNLTMNAIDASDPGENVVIRLLRTKEAMRIEIEDRGCGIEEANRHLVFDPFFTTKKRGQGTGLGLSICAQIVRDHGGQIDFDSLQPKGTRFWITWPAAEMSPLAA